LSDTEGRAEAYRLLAACFHAPDAELIRVLRAAARAPFSDLAELLSAEDGLESAKIDHARLFVGPFKLLAPPYGSVYLEEAGALMGDTTVDAREHYRREGLDLAIREVPDHVAVELEFMHLLICRQLEASRRSDGSAVAAYLVKQAEFLKLHLGRWIGEFAARAGEMASTRFYGCLAETAERLVLGDVEVLRAEAPAGGRTFLQVSGPGGDHAMKKYP
jgi:TorA maturation chaperone TorD